MELLQALEQEREQRNLSIRAFAKSLGITHPMYMKTLRGERRVGHKLLKGIASSYPELWDQARKELELQASA